MPGAVHSLGSRGSLIFSLLHVHVCIFPDCTCLCIVLLHTGSGVWTSMNMGKNISYFPYDDLHPALEGFIRFWTYLIIYQVTSAEDTHMHSVVEQRNPTSFSLYSTLVL